MCFCEDCLDPINEKVYYKNDGLCDGCRRFFVITGRHRKIC